MKTKPEHTPGPWKVGTEQNHSADRFKRNVEWARIRGADNSLIAEIASVHPVGFRQSSDFDIEAARVQLIARAPDMEQRIVKLEQALREVYEDWATLTGKDLAENNADVARIDALVRAALGA